MPVGKYGEYSPSFIEAVEDYLRSGQRPADMRVAATKAATGTTGPERRDSATKLQKMMAAFLGQAQADPSIIDDFISFQRQKLGDAVASGEGRDSAREVLVNLRDIQALLTEQRQFPESGEAPKTTEELIARLESPEMEAERKEVLADVKEDPADKYTKAVSADDYYNADKRADQKREEFTEATGLEVAPDEDFTVDPPESDAQVAERVKADKMLAETKAAGEKMEAERKAAAEKAAAEKAAAEKAAAEKAAEAPAAEKKAEAPAPDTEDVLAPDMEGMLESIKESSATDMPEPEPLDTNPDPARAEALPISEDDQALRLFRVAHGGDFDPKSSLDKRKIDKIRQLLVQQGGQGDMTDNQFALKLYRQ